MSNIKKSEKVALDRLAKALVDDILNASDSEILAEAKEEGIDSAAVAARQKRIYRQALAEAGKSRLSEAKAAVEAERRRLRSGNVARFDPATARARLQSILNQEPETQAKLTMAARKGEGLSDADVQSMLEDLEELGLLPPNNNEGRSE